MNNFFLFNDALNTDNVDEFEQGIQRINESILEADLQTDFFIKDPEFWSYLTVHGYTYDLPNYINPGLINLAYKVFEVFKNGEKNITDEGEFDFMYPLSCNGFKGFNFSKTTISANRQITDKNSFRSFKLGCSESASTKSVKKYWENKGVVFPNLSFCDRVQEEIDKYSINDDRFKLMNDKLTKLQQFTKEWKTGTFDHKQLPLDCSPDTPKRIKDTEELRTFHCEGIGTKVFSLHIK